MSGEPQLSPLFEPGLVWTCWQGDDGIVAGGIVPIEADRRRLARDGVGTHERRLIFRDAVEETHRSEAQARARCSIAAGSGSPPGTSQLPPTHSTASSASQSAAVCSVMPPVGQKRHW